MASRAQFVALFVFVSGALAVSGCGSAASDAEGVWGQASEGSPQLVLDAEGSLSGTDGCNTLMGSWSQEGDTVTFSGVATTLMECPDVDTWLSLMDSATVDGDTLRVHDDTGADIGTLDR